MGACCKGCEERQVGCHSTCEKYKTFRDEWDKEKEKREQYKRQHFSDYDLHKRDAVLKVYRKKQRYGK